MVEVELSKILITETSEHQAIWLREKGGERSFPILISIFEAIAINRKIRGEATPRPLTHDLLASVIENLDATVDRVIVNALQRDIYYAKLIIQQNGRTVEVDARPSDAVALAVRTGSPIFVAEDVIDQACRWGSQTN